jgi:hypothetical protein
MDDVGLRAVAFIFRPVVGLTFGLLLLSALVLGAVLNVIVEHGKARS